MPTLWEQLDQLYPTVLSADPAASINGTRLLERLKGKLTGDYAEQSIRQHFSLMSKDSSTSIAKVTGGQGYYLRQERERVTDQASRAQATSDAEPGDDSVGRDYQLEEKFRAVFMRYEARDSSFPMHVEHTRATGQAAGVNRWKFPDVILLDWAVGRMTDQGYGLDPDLLQVNMSLGEQSFLLSSVELKVGLSLPKLRENFFQCVSNSKWAHRATLAIANGIDDDRFIEELRRLGASYEVSIECYGLSNEFLESLPPASQILQMGASEFENTIGRSISVQRISTGRERPSLDWEHIRNLRSQISDFRVLFEWIAHCLIKQRPYSFEDYSRIQAIEKKIG